MFHKSWQFCSGLAACLLLLLIIEPRVIGTFLPDWEHSPRAIPDLNRLFMNSASMSPRAVEDSYAIPFESFRRPPPDIEGLGAIQHTPSGRVRLGRSFFQRFLKSNIAKNIAPEVQKWIVWRNQGARPGLDREPDPFVVTDPHWTEMANWWNKTPHWHIDADEWGPVRRRFEALAAMPDRTREEDQELWQAVVTCGRTWLKIPYDPANERFDLEADLPADAPEVAVRYYRRMYYDLAGYEYGELPSDGFRTGVDIEATDAETDDHRAPALP